MVEESAGSRRRALPLIVVGDSRLALGGLAAALAQPVPHPGRRVAGSNGKTTVKEMLAAILRAHFGERQVLATRGNLNNDIGLPLTLASPRGARVRGDRDRDEPSGRDRSSRRLAGPDVALINNAQREHQEFLQSVEEVAASTRR